MPTSFTLRHTLPASCRRPFGRRVARGLGWLKSQSAERQPSLANDCLTANCNLAASRTGKAGSQANSCGEVFHPAGLTLIIAQLKRLEPHVSKAIFYCKRRPNQNQNWATVISDGKRGGIIIPEGRTDTKLFRRSVLLSSSLWWRSRPVLPNIVFVRRVAYIGGNCDADDQGGYGIAPSGVPL